MECIGHGPTAALREMWSPACSSPSSVVRTLESLPAFRPAAPRKTVTSLPYRGLGALDLRRNPSLEKIGDPLGLTDVRITAILSYSHFSSGSCRELQCEKITTDFPPHSYIQPQQWHPPRPHEPPMMTARTCRRTRRRNSHKTITPTAKCDEAQARPAPTCEKQPAPPPFLLLLL